MFDDISYERSYPFLLFQDLQMPTLMSRRRARRAESAWSRGGSFVVLAGCACRGSMLTPA